MVQTAAFRVPSVESRCNCGPIRVTLLLPQKINVPFAHQMAAIHPTRCLGCLAMMRRRLRSCLEGRRPTFSVRVGLLADARTSRLPREYALAQSAYGREAS